MFSFTKAQPRYGGAQHAALKEKSETLRMCLRARGTKRLMKEHFPVSFQVYMIGALQAAASTEANVFSFFLMMPVKCKQCGSEAAIKYKV